MASVNFKNSKGEEDSLYMDDRLHRGAIKTKDRLIKKDADDVYLVDGGEGAGKSVFAMQFAKAIDSSFNIERICFTPDEFIKAIQDAQKGQAIIYDEAYSGLASRQSLSEINKLIVSMMMEMRQKNLVVIIVLPTFFMLDKYVAIFRSRGLFHIYQSRGRRGYFLYYNNKNKKKLYLLGRKLMDYRLPRVDFRGKFYGKYVVDEEEYRRRKDYALKNRDTKSGQNEKKHMYITENLVCKMYFQDNKSIPQIFEELKAAGIRYSQASVGFAIQKHREKWEKILISNKKL